MKLRDLGEFPFIERIAPGSLTGDPDHVLCGIGDDAAVVEDGGQVFVISTDMLIERVHFRRDTIDPATLGAKALAVNLSDIAAMGAIPRDVLVSIAAPADTPVQELDEFFSGLKALASRVGVNLVGGDTTMSRMDLCIGVTVIGVAPRDQILYRSGARIGDRILVTGTLGDAAAGLLILTDPPAIDGTLANALITAHVSPCLYLEEARIFATSGMVHAAIDLSDGISSDIGHVCRASGVAAVLESDAIPLSDELLALCAVKAIDPLELALAGGEDYRLLVTADPDGVAKLRSRLAAATGCPLFDVGEIVAGTDVFLREPGGMRRPLTATGWDGFRSTGS